MKIWIIYDSKFGNNKRIAQAIKDQLSQHEVEMMYAKKISPRQVIAKNPDALLLGGPRHAGKISWTISHWIQSFGKKIQAKQIRLKKIAAWETHGIFKPEDMQSESKMERRILEANMKIPEKWKELLMAVPSVKYIQEPLSLEVKELSGPLEEGFLEKVISFVANFEQL